MKVLTKDKRKVVVIDHDASRNGRVKSGPFESELTQEDVDYIASSYLSSEWVIVKKSSLDSDT